jgi:hypothetical protein
MAIAGVPGLPQSKQEIANGTALSNVNSVLVAAQQNGNAQAQTPASLIGFATAAGGASVAAFSPSSPTGFQLPNPLGAGAGDAIPTTVGSPGTGGAGQPAAVAGAMPQTPTQLAGSIETWLSSGAVEIGIAILGLGLLFFALTETKAAQTIIRNVIPSVS